MNKNQNGFGVMSIVMVIATVAVIGAVGWLLWQNVSQSSETTTNTDASTGQSKSADNEKEVELTQQPTAPKYDLSIHPDPAE